METTDSNDKTHNLCVSLAETLERLRKSVREGTRQIDLLQNALRKACPHREIVHRSRSCAEDDGPFDTCKLCGKDCDGNE